MIASLRHSLAPPSPARPAGVWVLRDPSTKIMMSRDHSETPRLDDCSVPKVAAAAFSSILLALLLKGPHARQLTSWSSLRLRRDCPAAARTRFYQRLRRKSSSHVPPQYNFSQGLAVTSVAA